MTPQTQAVLADLRKHGECTAPDIAKRVGAKVSNARDRLNWLIANGYAEQIGTVETAYGREAFLYRALPQTEEMKSPVDVWALHRVVQSMVHVGREEVL